MPTFWDGAKEKVNTVLITGFIGLLTVFSDNIVSSIKEKINIADKKPAVQEKIAKEISSLIYDAEMVLDYATQNLTKKNELHLVNDPFNLSIELVRKNELVNQALIERYWGTTARKSFVTFHQDIRSLEKAYHSFNEQYSAVESGERKRADPDKMKPLIPPALAAFEKARTSAVELATALGK